MTESWGPRTRAVSFGVAALIAVLLLWYSVRDIDWREVARIARGAAPGPLMLGAAMGTGALFVRACRWRVLLNAEGSIGVSAAFWAAAAGWLGNNFLPARAGELVRTFMISSQSTLASAYVLATALSERVADAVALVVVSAAVLLTLSVRPDWMPGAARTFAVVGALGALSVAVLPRLESIARAVLERAPLSHGRRARLMAATQDALRGMRAFHDVRRLSTFLVLTALIWAMDALGVVVTGTALGFRIPVSVALLLIAALSAGTALPSTPGYIGIYQFVAVTVLTPFGFSRTDAIVFILVAQALTYVVIGFWGSLGLLRYRRARYST